MHPLAVRLERRRLFRKSERKGLVRGNETAAMQRREGGRKEGGRASESEKEREGLVDPARYQEPPLPGAPISTPTLCTPSV